MVLQGASPWQHPLASPSRAIRGRLKLKWRCTPLLLVIFVVVVLRQGNQSGDSLNFKLGISSVNKERRTFPTEGDGTPRSRGLS